MRVDDFDYELPGERIAQVPLQRRDASRLMTLERETGRIGHRVFSDLQDLLRAGDLLVLNDTRVLPARLWGRKSTGGRVELFLLEKSGPEDAAGSSVWRCLLRASKDPRPGAVLDLGDGLSARVLERDAEIWLVRLEDASGDPDAKAERLGQMPLPPYIERDPEDPREELDRERYQTVYARRLGAVAAPTAGLHFTPGLLESLERGGVSVARLTLHVGLGTFQPVRSDTVEEHRMHSEAYELSGSAATAINEARARRSRIVAVGTTVVRVIETAADESGRVSAGAGRCDLFIYPGYRFKAVDALVTNFHLPRSTLLMLVSAFAGREKVLAAYAEAVKRGYRFYSYGDSMLVRSSA